MLNPIIRQLITFMQPFRIRVLIALLLATATIGSSIALMMTSAWLISTAGLQLGITSLGVAPVGVRLFGISRAVFRYLERLVSHDVTFRLLAVLRVWFYTRIEPLSPAQLRAFSSGDLMSRVVSDIEELQNLYLRVIAPPIVAIIITIFTGVAFAFIDPMAALVLVIFMVAAGTLLPLFTWWAGRVIGAQLIRARALLNTHMVDSVQGLADSLAYGYTRSRTQTLHDINTDLTTHERQMARLDGVQGGLSVLMVNLAAFCVLLVAIGRVEGVLLATLVLGTIAAFEAITPLALSTQHLGKEMTAAERVFDVIETTTAVDDPTEAQTIPSRPLHLQLHEVSFRYAPTEPRIFDDFSLNVPPGTRLAVMGESGTGKSSLVNVLLRFWDYETGSVTIGGVDLKTIGHEDIRRTFGVMTQRTHLFNTTIKENIRIARKTASDDAVIEAAKAAQIHDFIHSLPDGYDTYVGENGAALSGGERQRIALARILLKDAPIWLLDEITANLDPITANRVIQTVMQAAQDKTIIVLTHNTSWTDGFDLDETIRLSSSTR